MSTLLTHNQWMLALRGLLAVLFGVAVLAWPGLTLGVLVPLFGAFALIYGLLSAIMAFRDRSEYGRWWIVLLEGLVGVVAGVIAFAWTGITALALLYLIVAWAILTGLIELVSAYWLRQEISNEWLLPLSGIVSVIFGVVLAFWPGADIFALAWLIGVYAIVFGALLLILTFRLRQWSHAAERQVPKAA